VTLTTSFAEYSWLNAVEIWAPGTVDFAKAEIRFNAYGV